MDRYKIIEVSFPGIKLQKPFQVLSLRYVYANGTPQYKMQAQFSRLEDAQAYIKEKEVQA